MEKKPSTLRWNLRGAAPRTQAHSFFGLVWARERARLLGNPTSRPPTHEKSKLPIVNLGGGISGDSGGYGVFSYEPGEERLKWVIPILTFARRRVGKTVRNLRSLREVFRNTSNQGHPYPAKFTMGYFTFVVHGIPVASTGGI